MILGPCRAPATTLGFLLAASAMACVATGSADEPMPPLDDPYAAVAELSASLARMSMLARQHPASDVPYGGGEGALHVLRLMRRAIDEEIAWADTDHPYFQVQDERYAKLALGNPDNLYLVARAEEGATYRIHGRVGTTADFNLQVYQGYPGIHRPFLARGAIGIVGLETEADGRFEIQVGGPERAGNWIPLESGSRRILVRFTYGDS